MAIATLRAFAAPHGDWGRSSDGARGSPYPTRGAKSPPFDKTDRAGEGDLSGVRWSYPLRTLAGDACGTRAAAGPSEGVVIRGSSSMYGTSCVAPYSEQCSFRATAMRLHSCRVGEASPRRKASSSATEFIVPSAQHRNQSSSRVMTTWWGRRSTRGSGIFTMFAPVHPYLTRGQWPYPHCRRRSPGSPIAQASAGEIERLRQTIHMRCGWPGFKEDCRLLRAQRGQRPRFWAALPEAPLQERSLGRSR